MEDSPSKRSVAELAGRLRGHVPAAPSAHDEVPCGRRPPCSLRLQHPKQDGDDEAEKHAVSPNPLRIRTKSSPVIEKLQANLALSPAALLPSPKSPDVKLQPAPLTPPTPCGPPRPGLQPSQPSAEEEDPSSFDGPPDGAPLQSINKTRARLSFKRRPPTRQHRRSAGEEAEASGSEAQGPKENGDEHGDLGGVKEDEDRDCDKAEDEERRTSEEASEEEERPSGSDVTAEDVTQDTQHGGDDEG